MDSEVKRIIERLDLQPHPEGGYFRETYRAEMTVTHPAVGMDENGTRAAGTSIYFMVPRDDFSAFHRVRTDETWHLYDGGPLELHLIDPDGVYQCVVLSRDLGAGEPQFTVPAHWWQAARCDSAAAYALGGCTVAPGFDFADFELPDAAEIIAQHPQHEAIIRALTRH